MFFKITLIVLGLLQCSEAHAGKSESVALYEAVNKLLNHAELDLQDAKIAVLIDALKGAKTGVDEKEEKVRQNGVANTYTRWGRKTCPDGASLVYQGYAAGGMYHETGAASNYLCLPKNPDWKNHSRTPKYFGLIYGAEYESYDTMFDSLKNDEVPCAVCRVPRTNIIMIPGKNTCFDEYKVEYEGYLMAGHPKHKAASEYVCVDGEPEQTSNSVNGNENGKLFHFVRAVCGSLKCPPYKTGDDLTCVVCSYSP
ncbi:short-chain collagen C4-like [Ruditapes philippinarum]|uniref:short-chain collagen C4-like n=1 Tax=Ruditapes philippinarum TaxID=129788 RepID=UPI00295BACE7|nr:short-chain collagen C4-like [Ruditapes philippinarum]